MHKEMYFVIMITQYRYKHIIIQRTVPSQAFLHFPEIPNSVEILMQQKMTLFRAVDENLQKSLFCK